MATAPCLLLRAAAWQGSRVLLGRPGGGGDLAEDAIPAGRRTTMAHRARQSHGLHRMSEPPVLRSCSRPGPTRSRGAGPRPEGHRTIGTNRNFAGALWCSLTGGTIFGQRRAAYLTQSGRSCQRPHLYQGSAPGLVSPGWDLRPGRMYRWRPLETARNRSAPMACGPNVDQATPARQGQRRSAWRTLAGKADPCRLPPISEPRLGRSPCEGALAGSGTGTSPYIDGLSLASGRVVPSVPLVRGRGIC
jgi:hypothetical protein